MDYKTIISIIGVILSFVGYGVYVRDIIARKTIPHTFTFLIWGIASSVTWGLQVHGGAGVGAWITLAVSLICIFIFFLSLKYGEKDITKLDVFFLVTSFIALFLWLVVDRPVWSIILLVATDVSGFGPTVRKSWNKPHNESLFTWELTAFRHGLTIFALEKFNILTLLYPVVWTFVNIALSAFLIIRRKQIKQQTPLSGSNSV